MVRFFNKRPRLLGHLRISKKSSTFAAELYKNNTQQFVNLLLCLLEWSVGEHTLPLEEQVSGFKFCKFVKCHDIFHFLRITLCGVLAVDDSVCLAMA